MECLMRQKVLELDANQLDMLGHSGTPLLLAIR